MNGFEWDEAKSKGNREKHGIAFQEAIEIWAGPHLEIETIAYAKNGESRGATIGLVRGDLFTAIWTKRGRNLRLISVRRSRSGEKEIYWKKTI